MSNNSIANIRASLLTHLGNVTELKQVVSGRTFTSTGFPFCRVYLLGVEDKQEDQQANFRTYKFAIELIQEISNKDKDDAEGDFQDAVDAVMDKLNAQWDLKNGSNVPQVDYSKIEAGNIQTVEAPFGPAVLLQIVFSAKTLIY